MKMIEDLYESISLEDLMKEDSEEYTSAADKARDFIEKYVSLEQNKKIELHDLVAINRCAAQKQGFEIGFKYAMGLMKECFE